MAAAEAAGHTVLPLKSNLQDTASLCAEVAGAPPDAVVHLAAISFVGHADARAFYDVNLFGTLNLLDALAALRHAPNRILLASSANVYGNVAVSPISEETPPSPVNHYAMSKLAMEHMARTYVDRLPLMFTRPFNYTGPGQSLSFVIPKLVDHFRRRAAAIELGNLNVEREFNDVRMVCDAYLKLLEHGEPGEIYNVCTGRTLTLKGIIDRLQDLTGHALEIKTNPAFVRTNEVHRLCGSPAKLEVVIGPLKSIAIDDTLRRMLNSPTQSDRR